MGNVLSDYRSKVTSRPKPAQNVLQQIASGQRQSKNVEDRRGDSRMSDDERRAAVAASYVDQALGGMGDHALAYAMSMLPGRATYDDELERANLLQWKLKMQDPVSNVATRAAGLASPLTLARSLKFLPQGMKQVVAIPVLQQMGGQLLHDLTPGGTTGEVIGPMNLPGPPVRPFSQKMNTKLVR